MVRSIKKTIWKQWGLLGMGGRLHYTLVIVEICLWDAGRVAVFPLEKQLRKCKKWAQKMRGGEFLPRVHTHVQILSSYPWPVSTYIHQPQPADHRMASEPYRVFSIDAPIWIYMRHSQRFSLSPLFFSSLDFIFFNYFIVFFPLNPV